MCLTGWRAEFDCLCHETAEWFDENYEKSEPVTVEGPFCGDNYGCLHESCWFTTVHPYPEPYNPSPAVTIEPPF
jgi:hypothetical protein